MKTKIRKITTLLVIICIVMGNFVFVTQVYGLTNTVETATASGKWISYDKSFGGINVIRSNGKVECYFNGQLKYGYGDPIYAPPAELSNVLKITSYGGSYVALKSDGTVTQWGYSGLHPIPEGLENVVDISGAGNHVLAVKNDGTVEDWGQTYFGTLDIPDGLTDVVAIETSLFFVVALKSDGTIVQWGSGRQLPEGLSDVVALSVNGQRAMALKSDGTVVDSWDDTPILSDVVAIACGGDDDYLALKSDGTVVQWAWENVNPGIGLDPVYERIMKTPPAGLNDVVAIDAGFLAVKSDGMVVEWGGSTHLPQGFTLSPPLESIYVNGAPLAGFDPDTLEYTLPSVANSVTEISVAPFVGDVDNIQITVNGVVKDSGSLTTVPLTLGDNSIEIKSIIRGENIARTYTLHIRVLPSLSDIYVDSEPLPEFDIDTLEYQLPNVANSATEISIVPILEDPTNTHLTVNGVAKDSGSETTIPLNLGDTTIAIETFVSGDKISRTYTLHINRALPSDTNADLYDLTINLGVLTPAFDSDTHNYSVGVDNNISSIDITLTPAESGASTSINGLGGGTGTQTITVALDEGDNNIEVFVRASDNTTTKTYSLVVTRGPSSNADLTDLLVASGSLDPAFNPKTVSYAVYGVDDASSIDITASLDNSGSTLTINGQEAQSTVAQSVYLDHGGNLIPIVVTAPDRNTQKSYVLSINGKVDNADLSSLTVSEGDISFDKDTTEYYVNVDNDIETIDVSAITSDNKALVLINGGVAAGRKINLNLGENPIEIMVVAQDASAKTYRVTINRGAGEVNLSVLTLSQGNLSPAFEPSVTGYTASVPYTVNKIVITPIPWDNQATVTINGKSSSLSVPLEVGENIMNIVVTGKDGVSSKTYQVIVTRKEELSINNSSLPIGIVGGTYNAFLIAEGGISPYTWTAEGLPEELTLSTTGEIAGILEDEENYTVEVKVTDATGSEASKTLNLKVNLGCGNGAYSIQPHEDSAYTGGYTEDGIPTMTVNEGVSGFKYFSVLIEPVKGHDGNEVCVFVHLRNGQQIGISGIESDFDTVNVAKAAFNVKAGDIIKVHIVDKITNDLNTNPNVL